LNQSNHGQQQQAEAEYSLRNNQLKRTSNTQ